MEKEQHFNKRVETGYSHAKTERKKKKIQTQTLRQFTKINPKWITDKKVKYKIIKLLQVNTGEEPGDILFGMTFLKKNFYLFFGHAGSLLLHKLFSSFGKRGLLSSCPAWAVTAAASPVVEHGLQGAQASVVATCGLKSADTVVVADGLSCFAACGISLDQASNLYLLHRQVSSLPRNHQESPRYCFSCWQFISKQTQRFLPLVDFNFLVRGRQTKSKKQNSIRIQHIRRDRCCRKKQQSGIRGLGV